MNYHFSNSGLSARFDTVTGTAAFICVLRRAAFQAAAATTCHEAQEKSNALRVIEPAATKMAARRAERIPAFQPLKRWAAGKPPLRFSLRLASALIACAFALVRSFALDPETLTPGDVGSPSAAGSTVYRSGVIQIIAGGQGIGARNDQFHFAAAPESGDFDVRVRVAALKNTGLWAKAGLMLRADRSAGARFAGVFATPTGAGCLFQSRDTAGGDASSQGSFPANQPFAWLRLRRAGSVVTGYAGYDGRRWTVLGSKSLALDANALLGLAATSHSVSETVAEFYELSEAAGGGVESVRSPNEPIGPSNRRSAVVISEIMYHPAERADGKELEFVEIYNSQPYYEDISGWKLAGQIDFAFPPGTILPGGGFLVVAAAPNDLQAIHAIDRALGPYQGKLSNGGGTLRLTGDHDAVFFEVSYNDRAPWPLAADGGGHSLVLARPSFGEANPRAWSASRLKGGSPGAVESFEAISTGGVRINESLLPDAAGNGFVELFNAADIEADLSGVRLGNSPEALAFAFPATTKLPAGGFVQITWKQLGFALNSAGGRVYLGAADGSRLLDTVAFGPQWPGQSTGRWPNGGESMRQLGKSTPGALNARPASDIVINEIHFNPITGERDQEFIELFNAGAAEADLSGWKFTAGIDVEIPAGTRLAAGGYLVVARNAARLREAYPSLGGKAVVGNFQGRLSGRGERLTLSRPVASRNESTGKIQTLYVEVAEAQFHDGGRGSHWADGGGSTLELIDPRADAGLPGNWADSEETKRGEWITVEVSGVLDNGPGANSGGGGGRGGGTTTAGTTDGLQILLMGEGECLVDNVEVLGPDGANLVTNGDFEQGVTGWTMGGNHIRSSAETTEGDRSSQSLHLRASNNGDTGANKVFARLTQTLRLNQTATIRARVRWLKGWPEILLRLRGNYLEAYGRLKPSLHPGTPGERNGRSVANAGPAISEVSHFPVLPEALEPVRVTARVDDPDGVATVTLRYRVDPERSYASVTLRDDGAGGDVVAGDGQFSGTIPGLESGKLIAFSLAAFDSTSSGAGTAFPPDAPARECLVRFGEGVSSGAFGTYRLWVTQDNVTAWQDRPNLSNEPVESTFVYGNSRVVYNAGGRYAGSPYHQSFRTLAGDAHYVIELPKDDRVLGATAFNKIHAPGNGPFDDVTLQREQVVNWLARQMGMPWLYRRYVHVYINGLKRRTLMEDTQVGSDDFAKQYWPADADGDIFKMQPWFEFTDGTAQSLQFQNTAWCYVQKFTDAANQHKTRRYRWNWLVRGVEGTSNNFTNVFALADTATDFASPDYAARVENLVDVDEWMRFFAINHAAGNWDSVGYRNCQNTYSYKPRNGRWELIIWDANIVYGNSRSDGPENLPLFTTSDPTLSQWFAPGSPFRRRLLSAYSELVNGPMQPAALTPMLDAKYAAFQEHGVTAQAPGVITTWIGAARNYILSQIAKDSAPFAVTRVSGASTITLAGAGPLDMAALQVNGAKVNVTWDTTSTWQAALTLPGPTNRLAIVAVNSRGYPVANTRTEIALDSGAVLVLRREGGDLVFEYPASKSGRYQVQGTASLLQPDWRSVIDQEAGAGVLRLRVPAPSAPYTFYRILQP